MFGTKLNYDSRLFLEGEEVSGINTVDFSYSNSATTVNPLGFSDGLTTINGETRQSFSFTRDFRLFLVILAIMLPLNYRPEHCEVRGHHTGFQRANRYSCTLNHNAYAFIID